MVVAAIASIAALSPGAATPEAELATPAAPSPTLSVGDVALLNRITWGTNASTAQRFSRLGADAFIREQLHPPSGERLPPAVQAQINALKISQQPAAQLAIELEQQRRDANVISDPERKREARRVYRQALADLRREAATR
ncbi:MAG: DUF1800 family protein, partial [Xanthobacteraceae bacterium]|nr:DUF1800 family protein [Xanthobacteraceae bacterium]